MVNFNVNFNNSIQLIGSKIIYIDPYEISGNPANADYVFCTHSHYDHFSASDIQKVINENSKIITVESSKNDAIDLVGEGRVLIVKPNENYKIDDLEFSTTYAYNVDKHFHPKDNGWVGFIICLDGEKFYIAGDTDNIPEIQDIKTDYAFLPVGGTFTMDYKEAANLANTITAKVVVPTHYGAVAGSKLDGQNFKSLVDNKEVIDVLYIHD